MLSPAMRSAAGVTDTAADRIQRELDAIGQSSRRATGDVDGLRNKLNSLNNISINKGGLLGSIVGGNLIAQGLSKGLDMLISGGIDVFNTSMDNIGTKSALNATTKGRGQDAFDMTAALSNKYGLNLQANLQGVKTLTGGLMGMNLSLEKQMEIFEGVAVGAAALKLNNEQLTGAMLALGQMASKGTVSAEELRGQLGERIPGAFGIAAKAMGVTEQELNKMLQTGSIAASDFLPKFAAEMQNTFGGEAVKNMNGPHAVVERFNNAMFQMKTNVGEGLMPLITPMIEGFTYLANSILPYINEGISQITSWVSGINIETGTWGVWMDIIRMHVTTIWNGLKSVGMNVWNIVSGVFTWLANSQIIQDIMWLIEKGFQAVWWVVTKVGNALEWIWSNILKPILDAIESVYVFTKGILGFGGDKTTVEQKVTVTPAATVPGGMVTPATLPMRAVGTTGAGGGLDAGKSKADSINNGGQRVINISIGKQIEKLEVHVMNAQEGVNEIETMVREAMRRVLYNMNGVAAS